MPAYPFSRALTFAEFKERLENEYQTTFIEGSQFQFENDDPQTVWYFQREVDGETLKYVCDNYDDNMLIKPLLIRSVCKHLNIPFENDALFGLNLG